MALSPREGSLLTPHVVVREQLTATQIVSMAPNRQSLNMCLQEARRTSLLIALPISVRQSRAAGLRPMGRAGRLLRPGLRYRPVKPALQTRVACA
jgi:hypothetical protein